MKILGIDPGLTHTGWGVIEAEAGRLAFVAAGRISTQASAPMAARLADIYTELSRILDLYAPAAAAVEATFVNANPASALKLGQARGVALLAPATRGLPVFEYAANVVKKSVVGAGHADKAQIGAMVRILLPRAGDLAVDAADALAIAITHAHHAPPGRALQNVSQ